MRLSLEIRVYSATDAGHIKEAWSRFMESARMGSGVEGLQEAVVCVDEDNGEPVVAIPIVFSDDSTALRAVIQN
jgi:hypothetical protein